MEILFAAAIGVLVAAAAYLLLARDLPRALLGFVLLGTTANLSIFAAGRIGRGTRLPPQFGQSPPGRRVAAQSVHQVHSKEQISASRL